MNAKSLKYKQTTGVAAAVTVASLLDSTLLSGGVPVAAVTHALVQPETNNVRWRDDGTAPTASVGNLLAAGQVLVVPRGQLSAVKIIEAAASAVVNVTGYAGTVPPFAPPGLVTNTSGGGSVAAVAAGDVAAGVADSGNPVKVGGLSSTTVPAAATTGFRVNAYFDPRGRLVVGLGSGASDASIGSGAGDGLSSATIGLFVHSQTFAFNGSNMDRLRNNNELTVLASAARTTATNSADLILYNGRGVVVTIDVTAYTAGASLTVSIKYKDTLSGQYVTLLASAAIVAVGTYTLSVGPGLPATANVSANAIVPRVYRVEVSVVNASSVTYSVSSNHTN